MPTCPALLLLHHCSRRASWRDRAWTAQGWTLPLPTALPRSDSCREHLELPGGQSSPWHGTCPEHSNSHRFQLSGHSNSLPVISKIILSNVANLTSHQITHGLFSQQPHKPPPGMFHQGISASQTRGQQLFLNKGKSRVSTPCPPPQALFL